MFWIAAERFDAGVAPTASRPLTLQYETVYGPRGGVVVVPARTSTAPYGEAFFTTMSAVGVNLFDGSLLLQDALANAVEADTRFSDAASPDAIQ